MFSVRAESSPMIWPQVHPQASRKPPSPLGCLACAPQIHNSLHNGRDFWVHLYKLITPAGCCLKSSAASPHPCSSSAHTIYDIFKEGFTDACVVECTEENVSKTNDYAIGSISRNPYGKSFRVIITLLVMCPYSSHLSHTAETNAAEWFWDSARGLTLHFTTFI